LSATWYENVRWSCSLSSKDQLGQVWKSCVWCATAGNSHIVACAHCDVLINTDSLFSKRYVKDLFSKGQTDRALRHAAHHADAAEKKNNREVACYPASLVNCEWTFEQSRLIAWLLLQLWPVVLSFLLSHRQLCTVSWSLPFASDLNVIKPTSRRYGELRVTTGRKRVLLHSARSDNHMMPSINSEEIWV